MSSARFGASASMLVDNKTMLISGGDGLPGEPLDSTEEFGGVSFRDFPKLPSARRYHCQVTLNSTHVAVLGGYNGIAEFQDFHLLDLESQDWIQMPDVPSTVSNRACGLIENSVNGQELVVLIDHGNYQIFNFKDNTWRDGPVISDGTSLARESMVAQMMKNFYVIGGQLDDRSTTTDAIYKFDAENYEWVRQDFSLSTPRRGGVAIPVPDHIVECP